MDSSAPPPHHAAIVLISRIFAVLAASCFVAAISLIVLAPPGMDLLHGLMALDPHEVPRATRLTHRLLGNTLWNSAAVPLLVRPVWLVPAGLALLAAGVAASWAPPTHSPHGKRFRQ